MATTQTSGVHLRKRVVNRRVQGDIGELSAMEWLARQGALIWLPVGHSPDVDLLADLGGRLIRVQVKTSTQRAATSKREVRWNVAIATNGGNRSWNGLTKRFDRSLVDYLFALVGDGRRWFIPATVIEASRQVSLGGARYSEFEIERTAPLETLVYANGNTNRIGLPPLGECQSGQMDAAVNRAAMPTQVRILPPPSPAVRREILVRPKRQVTLPKAPCEEAGIAPGDRLRVRAEGPGRVVFEKIGSEAAEPDAAIAQAAAGPPA
jgi:hypothetical protein